MFKTRIGWILVSLGGAASASSLGGGEEVVSSATSSNGDLFGAALVLEGDLALAGAPRDDTVALDAGRVVQLELAAGAWSETAAWSGLDTVAGDRFGAALAIDGTRALIGAPRHGGAGAAYVFERQGSAWTQTAKLTVPAVPNGGFFGAAVGLVGDWAFVGAPRAAADQGRVYVFERQAGVWTWTTTLVSSTSAANARFGMRIDVEGDRALIGAPNETLPGPLEQQAGAAYLFERSGTQWLESQQLTASNPGQLRHFGSSVALNGDLLAVGQPALTGFLAKVAIFEHDGGGFGLVQEVSGQFLVGSLWFPSFGHALAWEGDDLFVGGNDVSAPGAPRSGAVFVLRRWGAQWVSAGMLPNVSTLDQGVGASLAVHADAVLAGGASTAPGADVPGVVKVLPHALPDVYCTAKVASPGCQPRMSAIGQPGTAPFLLQANEVLRLTNGLLFYGFDTAAIPFFGGTLCVLPPLTRTPIMNSVGSADECSGRLTFNFTAWNAAGGDGQPGDTLYAQYWFRDSNDPDGVGLTNALMFELCP